MKSQIESLHTNIQILQTENADLQRKNETLHTNGPRDNYTNISDLRDYGNVTVEQSKLLIDSNPSLVILDVRTVSEYNSGHVEGAINVWVEDLESRLGELDVGTEYIVYCRLGVRSLRAMVILNDNGFSKVWNMVGGITAWIAAGYPTV